MRAILSPKPLVPQGNNGHYKDEASENIIVVYTQGTFRFSAERRGRVLLKGAVARRKKFFV